MSGKKEGDELTGKKFDISGASLKKEKKIEEEQEEEQEEEEEEEEEQEEEKDTVKFSETQKPEEDEEHEINFNSEEEVTKFTARKTKESQNKSEKEKGFGEETIEDVQKEISDAEKKANEIDPNDFYDIADFIITLIDSSAASALKWYSKDSSDSAYSLPKPKKDKLTKQLAKILIKYNARFSIEVMFIIGLIIMYLPAFRLARKNKKENTAQPIATPVQQVYQQPVHEYQHNQVVEEKNDEVVEQKTETKIEIVKPKIKRTRRGPGGPRKA